MTTVLFACTHNAGRSQMAAAFFNRRADPTRARATSAGTQLGDRVHPLVVAAMREVGIDLDAARPPAADAGARRPGSGPGHHGLRRTCPVVPGARREDWPLPDPKDQPLERVRAIRDEIRQRVEARRPGRLDLTAPPAAVSSVAPRVRFQRRIFGDDANGLSMDRSG